MSFFNTFRERIKTWGRKRENPVTSVRVESSPKPVQTNAQTITAAGSRKRRSVNFYSQRGRGWGARAPGGGWWSPWDIYLQAMSQQQGMREYPQRGMPLSQAAMNAARREAA